MSIEIPDTFNSPQEAFDFVVEHLRTQTGQSLRVGIAGITNCAYRSEDNLKCAVGIFIRDDEYLPSMEGLGASQLLTLPSAPESLKARLASVGVTNLSQFWNELQGVHDYNRPGWWDGALERFAARHNLTYKAY